MITDMPDGVGDSPELEVDIQKRDFEDSRKGVGVEVESGDLTKDLFGRPIQVFRDMRQELRSGKDVLERIFTELGIEGNSMDVRMGKLVELRISEIVEGDSVKDEVMKRFLSRFGEVAVGAAKYGAWDYERRLSNPDSREYLISKQEMTSDMARLILDYSSNSEYIDSLKDLMLSFDQLTTTLVEGADDKENTGFSQIGVLVPAITSTVAMTKILEMLGYKVKFPDDNRLDLDCGIDLIVCDEIEGNPIFVLDIKSRTESSRSDVEYMSAMYVKHYYSKKESRTLRMEINPELHDGIPHLEIQYPSPKIFREYYEEGMNAIGIPSWMGVENMAKSMGTFMESTDFFNDEQTRKMISEARVIYGYLEKGYLRKAYDEARGK